MNLHSMLFLSALLFCIGIYGVLSRRNLIAILMSVEIILNAAIINFISFARFKVGHGSEATLFSLFIIAIAACEMAVALGIILNLYRNRKALDAEELNLLNG